MHFIYKLKQLHALINKINQVNTIMIIHQLTNRSIYLNINPILQPDIFTLRAIKYNMMFVLHTNTTSTQPVLPQHPRPSARFDFQAVGTRSKFREDNSFSFVDVSIRSVDRMHTQGSVDFSVGGCFASRFIRKS